jgi:hypothetical protein
MPCRFDAMCRPPPNHRRVTEELIDRLGRALLAECDRRREQRVGKQRIVAIPSRGLSAR